MCTSDSSVADCNFAPTLYKQKLPMLQQMRRCWKYRMGMILRKMRQKHCLLKERRRLKKRIEAKRRNLKKMKKARN